MNKRYWLRGGIISILLYGLITLMLIPFGTLKDMWFPLWGLPSLLGVILLSAPINFLTGKDLMDELGILGAVIFYLLLGIIIGWIYGKIKNRIQVGTTIN